MPSRPGMFISASERNGVHHCKLPVQRGRDGKGQKCTYHVDSVFIFHRSVASSQTGPLFFSRQAAIQLLDAYPVKFMEVVEGLDGELFVFPCSACNIQGSATASLILWKMVVAYHGSTPDLDLTAIVCSHRRTPRGRDPAPPRIPDSSPCDLSTRGPVMCVSTARACFSVRCDGSH